VIAIISPAGSSRTRDGNERIVGMPARATSTPSAVSSRTSEE
jgi:hypothetical protein